VACSRVNFTFYLYLYLYTLDLAIVNDHILHVQKIKQMNPLERFIMTVTEGLISDVRGEIQDSSYYIPRES
jgi:hypothetical protein